MSLLDKIIGEEITKGPHEDDEMRKENKKGRGTKMVKGSVPNHFIPVIIAIGVLVIFVGGYFSYTQIRNDSPSQPSEEDLKIMELQQQITDLEKLSGQSEDIEALKGEVATLRAKTTRLTLTNAEIIDKVKPAVVYIETTDGAGSGMIIESDGYILTNAHVVEGVNVADITTSDQKTYKASIIGRNEDIDLAVLKITGSAFPTVEFGNSNENILEQGDSIFSVGYSYGFDEDISFKDGIISRRLTSADGIVYLEITAEIQPGNSGGPLVNKLGQVVGVNTFTYGKTGDPLKFAIPINTANTYIPELKSGKNIEKPDSVPVSAHVTVSLSSLTPSSGTVTREEGMAEFVRFNFCAYSEYAIITGLSITRQGASRDSDISFVAIDFQDGKPPYASTIDYSTHKSSGFPFHWGWAIGANSCRSLIVRADIQDNAIIGHQIQLSITSANDINSNIPIYGDFPITGNTMKIIR